MILYVAYLTKQGKVTSARDVTSLSQHLAPLANKPAAEISKRDLVSVQRTLLDAGKGRTANKLRSFVRAAYALVLRAESDATSPAAALDFATIGGVESNPAALLAVAKGFNGTRDRVLTDIELFTLLDHAKAYPGLAGLAVRATVFLGGQRMAQLLRASLTDIKDGFLVLLDPKGKRDVPRRHPIPLEGMAGVVIAEAVDRANNLKTDWLFNFNFSASFFKLSSHIFSFCFRYTLFNCLRSAINKVFCFFKSKASQVFNDLNNSKLASSTAL